MDRSKLDAALRLVSRITLTIDNRRHVMHPDRIDTAVALSAAALKDGHTSTTEIWFKDGTKHNIQVTKDEQGPDTMVTFLIKCAEGTFPPHNPRGKP